MNSIVIISATHNEKCYFLFFTGPTPDFSKPLVMGGIAPQFLSIVGVTTPYLAGSYDLQSVLASLYHFTN